MRYDGNAFTIIPETPMTPTPLTVTLPAPTMTVEALEALIAEAKAKAEPQPVEGQVYRHKRTTTDDPWWGGNMWRFRHGRWQYASRSSGLEVWYDSPVCSGGDHWRDGLLVPYVPPTPVPRFAVGDYAVYTLGPIAADQWGVVKIIEACADGEYRATSLTTPHFGNGRFAPSWLRLATPDEIAAATRIDLKVGMLLQRKSDGAVFRVYEVVGRCTICDKLRMGTSYGFSGTLLLGVSTLTYDVLDSYTIQGVK